MNRGKKTIVISIIVFIGIIGLGIFGLVSCHYPDIKEITPSQTAFLIPYDGDTTKQTQYQSEDFLKSKQVAGKRISIPKEYIAGHGWQPTMQLIIVERKPETREWTESNSTGTSSKNEGITAESKESIGFMTRMNCSAQIDEENTARFLYRYNNKPLSEIMDTEIRARVESKFVEECSKRTLDSILNQKEDIMSSVRNDVTEFFKERGITINTLGLKGEFTYLNPNIQQAIDEKFSSEQKKVTQANLNAVAISKAEADSKVIQMQTATLEKSLELKKLENEAAAIAKWDGKMPEYIGGGQSSIFNIPTK